MNPLGANTKHELESIGRRPGLLEEKINAPFRRVTSKQRRDTCLKFQPLLNRRNLNRHRRTEARVTLGQTPLGSSSKLKNGGGFLLNRLADGIFGMQKQRCYQHESGRVQTKAP